MFSGKQVKVVWNRVKQGYFSLESMSFWYLLVNKGLNHSVPQFEVTTEDLKIQFAQVTETTRIKTNSNQCYLNDISMTDYVQTSHIMT